MNPQRQSAYSDKFEIDLARVPVDMAAEVLQYLGVRLIRSLLLTGDRPILSDMIHRKELRLFAEPSDWQMGRHARRRPEGQSLLRTAVHWVGMVMRVVIRRRPGFNMTETARRAKRGLSTWTVRMRILEETERGLGGNSIYRVPRNWWTTVAVKAWLDLYFQREVGQILFEYLRGTLLFQIGAIPRPTFAPETFWMLILLAGSRKLKWWQRLHPGLWRNRMVASRLQRLVKDLAMVPEWAGLWDQLVLMEALRKWPEALDGLSSDVREEILSLPLWKEFPSEYGEISDDSPAVVDSYLARPNWADDLPGWEQHT